MKQKIKKIIVGMILIGILSLSVIAQTSGTWRQIFPSGSGVNDVARGSVPYITKTDGTVWGATPNSWRQMPEVRDAERIAMNGDCGLLTTRGGILYKLEGFLLGRWIRQNLVNFVNDVSLDEGCNYWISENTSGQTGVVSFNTPTSQQQINSFNPTNSQGFIRVAGGFTKSWGVGSNGTVWSFENNQWTLNSATGMGDVAVSDSGRVWLAGKEFINGQPNGTIWYSDDDGVTWVKDPVAQGFKNIAARDRLLYAVGFNGSLWVWEP